jgi:hypothetical protein
MLFKQPKNEKYLEIVERLYHFAHEVDGRDNIFLERNAYRLLQTHRSPFRALYRHARYCLWNWWHLKVVARSLHRVRWFWYRCVRRWLERRIWAFLADEVREDEPEKIDWDAAIQRLIKEESTR